MADEVTRFPVSTWNRIKNKRGKRTVNCEISGRYLTYGEGHDTGTNMGVLISVDVMTDGNDSDTPDRKICELVLPLNELKELVRLAEQDAEAKV
jgi:hypothetical protein